MSAYVIVDVSIHDPELYKEYKKLTPATISAHGGKFVVRGGEVLTMEGDWSPDRIVVLEFSDVEKAKEWWHSGGYSKAKAIRQAAATTKMLIVEGTSGDMDKGEKR